MTGQQLIDWIKEHNAEDKEVIVCYNGYTGDYGEPEPSEYKFDDENKGKIVLN